MRLIEGAQGPRVLLDGAEVLLLCSNNYLGLADHPAVRDAAAEAAERYGAGAGLLPPDLGQRCRCTASSRTGWRASRARPRRCCSAPATSPTWASIAALARRGDVVFSDELNHASIIDGCRLARAETFIYRHADTEHLDWGLRTAGARARADRHRRRLLDGRRRRAARRSSLELAQASRLPADGRRGPRAPARWGRAAAALSRPPGSSGEVDVIVGTLGKALGSYGAYVCGSRELVELLVNTARPFIFSTALPPPTRRRGRWPHWAARITRRSGSSSCAATPPTLRRGAQRRGLARRRLADPDRPGDDRRRRRRDGALRAHARGRRLRPGDPPADRARGNLAAAADGDGHPPAGELRGRPR